MAQPQGITSAKRDVPLPCQVEMKVPLHAGDILDFIVHPRSNMDCDGIYIVDIQIWQDSGDAHTWETRRRKLMSDEGGLNGAFLH